MDELLEIWGMKGKYQQVQRDFEGGGSGTWSKEREVDFSKTEWIIWGRNRM